MNSKKFLLIFLVVAVLGLLAVGGLVVYYDPFFQYHKPHDNLNYTIDNQINQNPGIARNFEYDSIILGSSMTVNFDTELFGSLLGETCVKLSYNAAFPKDNENILKIVRDTHPLVRNVYWGIDIHNYVAEAETVAYPVPAYLYDKSIWNDVSYWFNKDVLLTYVLLPHENTAMKDVYSFWRNTEFSKTAAFSNYSLPEQREMLPADTYIDDLKRNLEAYVIPFVESMPETQFTFFFPPYSTLYWNSQYAEGNMEPYLEGERYFMKCMLSYDNVSVYYFQDNWEIVTDFDRYSDYYHYDKAVNDYMTECFAGEENKVTAEEVDAVIDNMQKELAERMPLSLEELQ